MPGTVRVDIDGRDAMQRSTETARAADEVRAEKRAGVVSGQVGANGTSFEPGTPLVHVEYGVGRHDGLTRIELGDDTREFLTIRYADDDRLHVPVHALHLVDRHPCTDPDAAPLHALGNTTRWHRARERAGEEALESAARLLEARARRAALEGFGFKVDAKRFARFGAGFGHEPTSDQRRAIDAVVDDLASGQPMDRVICGDVGFGKTEVAMRAAFVAADAGTQVAVIVPTTVLARQHAAKLAERFAGWPMTVGSYSSLDAAEERAATLSRLAAGELDIVVGTQALLGDDVAFAELGLAIVDEEHRFGVGDKERVRALRDRVHVLTLTATPIPRTLQMGLGGVRDLSVIDTPPARRLPVETVVAERDESVALDACRRELARDGQVFWLHNEIDSIEPVAAWLDEMLPEADVRVAHGSLDERELERTMADFADGRFDVLVATTIVESGIDVPNANTIVVERADLLGLAQLHQLRGRVGRADRQAYALLLTPPAEETTADAGKRLVALAENDELGAGLEIARRDLDIRGAGELLGERQTGRVADVGPALYAELLSRAVAALERGEDAPAAALLDAPVSIELGRSAGVPESAIGEPDERLRWYLAITSAADEEALEERRAALVARLGALPPDTERLFDVVRLRLRCARVRIAGAELGAEEAVVVLADDVGGSGETTTRAPRGIDGGTLPDGWCVEENGTLRLRADLESHARRVAALEALIGALERSRDETPVETDAATDERLAVRA